MDCVPLLIAIYGGIIYMRVLFEISVDRLMPNQICRDNENISDSGVDSK